MLTMRQNSHFTAPQLPVHESLSYESPAMVLPPRLALTPHAYESWNDFHDLNAVDGKRPGRYMKDCPLPQATLSAGEYLNGQWACPTAPEIWVTAALPNWPIALPAAN